jgi:hypothetical protein
MTTSIWKDRQSKQRNIIEGPIGVLSKPVVMLLSMVMPLRLQFLSRAKQNRGAMLKDNKVYIAMDKNTHLAVQKQMFKWAFHGGQKCRDNHECYVVMGRDARSLVVGCESGGKSGGAAKGRLKSIRGSLVE